MLVPAKAVVEYQRKVKESPTINQWLSKIWEYPTISDQISVSEKPLYRPFFGTLVPIFGFYRER